MPTARTQQRGVSRDVGLTSAVATDAFEPDDTPATAKALAPDDVPVPCTFASTPGTGARPDIDYKRFEAEAGRTYRIEAFSSDATSHPWLVLFDAEGNPLMFGESETLGTRDAAIVWTCPAAGGSGTYLIAIEDIYGLGGSYTARLADLGPIAAATGTRIGGANRYEVAANVARARFPGLAGISRVVVVSGLDRSSADPLGAAGLAGPPCYNAPVLLVNQDAVGQLPLATASAIADIQAANPSTKLTFSFVGGVLSVPGWLKTPIGRLARGATYERIGAPDRYALSATIAARMRATLASAPTTCFVANGETPAYFYDALAASPVSCAQGVPLLLVRRRSVSSAVASECAAYPDRFVVGCAPEVDDSVVNALAATRIGDGMAPYSRRYVARLFAEEGQRRGWFEPGTVCVTNKLADALTGGTLAGKLHAPILYTTSATWLDFGDHLWTDEYLQVHRSSTSAYYVFGGPVSVSPDIFRRIGYLCGDTWAF
jgi:putative cell wall-binding protein